MRKYILILFIIAISLSSCDSTNTHRVMKPPMESEMPYGFEFQSDAGNGWFLYKSPVGYFLVSTQIQGSYKSGYSNTINMVYIGRELAR